MEIKNSKSEGLKRKSVTKSSNIPIAASSVSELVKSTEPKETKYVSGYWTISYGDACRTGFSCRECRKLIPIKAKMVVRDGRKMRLFYHLECFSGDSDPRTQQGSSYNSGESKYGIGFQHKAPEVKGRGKWGVAQYGYNG
jgi:hypothetical protein